jgi:hypothetical protein
MQFGENGCTGRPVAWMVAGVCPAPANRPKPLVNSLFSVPCHRTKGDKSDHDRRFGAFEKATNCGFVS